MSYDNYPDGAANDPRAPWNQKEPKFNQCEECEGTGKVETSCDYCNCVCMGDKSCIRCVGKCTCPDDIMIECEKCKGAGEIEIEEEDDADHDLY